MINLINFREDCHKIKEQSPIVLNITNYVAMSLSANSLLAVGASPLMSFFDEEIEELCYLCSSAVINIGCLDTRQIEAATLAAKTLKKLKKPWVLDPVGAGASRVRTQVALDLIKQNPSVIRANAAEIACLAGWEIKSKGVDSSLSTGSATKAADNLAKESGAVVSMSGAVDYICDGKSFETISNGHSLMPRVTAMGCTASALTGAFVAVDGAFNAALNAMALMGVAGQKAGERSTGTGSLESFFLDELSSFDAEVYANEIRQ